MARAGKATAAKTCPICGKPAEAAHAPFCSKRCADIDLHRWLTGRYAIPAAEQDPPPDPEEGEASDRSEGSFH